MTIKELINECNKTLIENKIQDSMFLSRRLLEYVINKDKQYLIINQNEKITIDAEKKYKALIQKVINGKPIQYITNKQEFMKMNFYVDENVLIPQPDTEILVEEVIDICNKLNKDIINVLDICTGSGVIGISIAKYCKN